MLLVLAASAAQAQCADPSNSSGGIPGLPATFGLPASSTVSGVQSLVSVLTTQNTAFLTQTSGFIGAPANPGPGTNGGGVWARGIGGTFDTNTPGNFTRFSSLLNPGEVSGSCNVRTFQDYAGFQTGADISRLNIDGYNIHSGVTMGYTESAVRSNGSFRADFQTPFVGIYGAITKGGFFADGQVRWDFFQGLLNDPNNTLTDQRLDARSVSFTGNVGYQIPLNDGWFVEPSGGAVYAEVKVDTLQTVGPVFAEGASTDAAPTAVKVKDFDSLLARGSLRIGKNFVAGDYALQPFITASVINEFGGPVRTDVSTSFGAFGNLFTPIVGPGLGQAFSLLDQSARINTYRIGMYGQFSAGIAGQILNTGWLGYFRGDYRTGDRVEGFGLSAGLRYQFNPELAARGLITKGDSPILAPLDGPVNWTGLSAGASVGGLWSQTRQQNLIAVFFGDEIARPHAAGVYAGGQLGADYQFGNIVVGVAGDAGYSNARGGRGCSPGFGGNIFNCQTNIDDLYMATGRVGYAVDRSLFYVKGGAAFANTSEKQQSNLGSTPIRLVGGTFPTSVVNAVSPGWTVGAGFEYALTKNWSAKAEYMHFELDRERYDFSGANIAFVQAKHTGDIVKVGVNYRFTVEPAPVAAPAVAARY